MKRFVSLLAAAAMVFGTAASAFGAGFPEPDWAGLLKERTSMVMEKDFELYVEGPADSGIYYGAKFEPKNGVYIGMTADSSAAFAPLGCYISYVESYNQKDLYYPSNKMVAQDDVITMVGWNVPSVENVNYDDADRLLSMLNSYNKPMLVRFANEMNCSGLGDDPELYVEVFRKIADLIHKYPNLAVVWSPNDMGALDRPFEYYYPGDEYVDWIGVSCYTGMYFMGNVNTTYDDSVYFMTGQFGWPANKVKPLMDFLEKNNIKKPVMISEGGVATNNSLGDPPEKVQAWARPRLENYFWNMIMRYPQIKMVNYFNVHRQYEAERYDISDYKYASDIYKAAASGGAYIRSLNGKADFAFAKAEKGGVLTAENGKVNLYTLAYIPQKDNISVKYKIDGTEMFKSSEIPYKWEFSVESISEGEHSLTIETDGAAKTYSLFRRGDSIRFGKDIEEARSTGDKEISVYIKEAGGMKKLSFDQPPVIVDGRTLVPVRAIFEAMGMKVDWDDHTKTASAAGGDTALRITIGEKKLYKTYGNTGEKAFELDVPAQIIKGRTLVPLRAIAESCDADVQWDGGTRTVTISGWSL